MKLNIPIEIVFDDVHSVIDELGKLQKYKLCEDDDMTLVDVDDVADVLTKHVMAREAKEPCGTKEGWIPCSERLPSEGDTVLLYENYAYSIGRLIKTATEEYEWSVNGWYTKIDDWSAWMPLPKPYGGDAK